MRTNIDIDEDVMRAALEATGLKTKKQVVEEGLRVLARRHKQHQALLALRGIGWEGDLDEMRRDRPQARGDW